MISQISHWITTNLRVDKMLKEFSCHRITKTWPFVLLTYIINVCALNAYVLYQTKFTNTALTRLDFLRDLCSEIVKPAIKTRANLPRTETSLSVQAAMASVIGPLQQQVPPPIPANSGKRKRNCYSFCPRSKDTKYSAKCLLRSTYICPEHTESNITTCSNCKCLIICSHYFTFYYILFFLS